MVGTLIKNLQSNHLHKITYTKLCTVIVDMRKFRVDGNEDGDDDFGA